MAKNNTKQEYSIIDNPGKGDCGVYTLICNFLLDNLLQYRQGTLTKENFIKKLETFVGQAVSKENIKRFNDSTENNGKSRPYRNNQQDTELLAKSLFDDLTTRIKSQDDLQNLIKSKGNFTFINKSMIATYRQHLANEQTKDLEAIRNEFRSKIASSLHQQACELDPSTKPIIKIPYVDVTIAEVENIQITTVVYDHSSAKQITTFVDDHSSAEPIAKPIILCRICPTRTEMLNKKEALDNMAKLVLTEVNKVLSDSNDKYYQLSEKQRHLLEKTTQIYDPYVNQMNKTKFMDYLIINFDRNMPKNNNNNIVDNLAKPTHWWSKRSWLSIQDMAYFNHNDKISIESDDKNIKSSTPITVLCQKGNHWVTVVSAQSSFILSIPKRSEELFNSVQKIVALSKNMSSNTNLMTSITSMSINSKPQTLKELESYIADMKTKLSAFQSQLSEQLSTATAEKDKLGAITKFFCKIIPFNDSYKTWMQLDAINNIQKQLNTDLGNLETEFAKVKSNIPNNTKTTNLDNVNINGSNSTQQINRALDEQQEKEPLQTEITPENIQTQAKPESNQEGRNEEEENNALKI